MHEIETIHFQLDPDHSNDIWDCDGSERVVTFMNETFNLNDIHYISPVTSFVNIIYYTFHVELKRDDWTKKLSFHFDRQGKALKCQRDLIQAWGKRGKYAAKVSSRDTVSSEQGQESTDRS